MKLPDLLPPQLRHARAKEARVRRWMWAGAVEAVGLTVACILVRTGIDGGVRSHGDLGEALGSVVSQVDALSASTSDASAELLEAQRRLGVMRQVVLCPDWSVLVTVVARCGEGLIVLDGFQLVAPTAARSADGRAGSYMLTLVGSGAAQQEVTNFAGKLEKTGLFHAIRPTETRRVEQEGGAARVAFTLECELEGGR